MTDFDQFERRLAAALRSDADQSIDPFEAERIARAAIAGTRPVRRFGRGRGITLLAAAALLLVGGALAAGSGLLRRPAVVPPVPAPSLAAIVVASPEPPSPSPHEPTSPSARPTPVPIAWTEASLKEDWPGLLRTEPAEGPILVPIPRDGYVDPTGDSGSVDYPWADIKIVDPTCLGDICVKTVGGAGPALDPHKRWIAYGAVVDIDGDGVPDFRYGNDNVPAGTPGCCGPVLRRWWRTDLHSGRTESTTIESGIGGPGWYWGPGDGLSTDALGFHFAVDTTTGQAGSVPKRLYIWASVIEDGRVVATDYAPDAGWFVPKP